jgi:exodeoxyribonuclease V alpha subunit
MKITETFSALDIHLAECLSRLSNNPSDSLRTAVKLVSAQTGKGNICLDLTTVAGCVVKEGPVEVLPSLEELAEILLESGVVGRPGDNSPLILDSPLLYLQRYYQYEKAVSSFVLEKAERSMEGDPAGVGKVVGRLFPEEPGDDGINWQKVASLVAFSGRLSVISGGPGTGKTTTVARLLALCLEMAEKKELKIMLAAPTGKAAARLQGALVEAKEALPCSEELKERVIAEAMTVHRLLGRGRAGFKYNKENPLSADIVVVDEASMVDLPLMARLMAAIPEKCRLILLGDRHQLASVQPGAVFGDLCQAARAGFSHHFNRYASSTGIVPLPVEENDRLADLYVELKQSYRFKEDSGIFAVSSAVKEGDGERALALLKDKQFADVRWQDLNEMEGEAFSAQVLARIQAHMKYVLDVSSPEEALPRMNSFAVLCARRHGRLGVENINSLAAAALADNAIMSTDWYHGRPVMVRRNHHDRQLYNGDSGLFWGENDEAGLIQVYFAIGSSIREFLPQQLPEHETAYAMTVHKSQGSEFEHVLLILPDEQSQVVTSELIYTALTRARKSIEVWGSEAAFKDAVASKVLRRSGLVKALSE